MKLYKPLFSSLVIVLQLILSIKDYFELQKWKKENPELDALLNLVIRYDTLFLSVLVIGVNEMFTKPSWLKILLRVLLITIVLGYEFSEMIPIENFGSGVYNSSCFLAAVSVILFLFRIEKHSLGKKNIKNPNKTSGQHPV